ncbi:MAG: 16S rRNA (cytosine(1402)-N(4))-methyltransferase RsmH [Chloroflexota bacterium]|jgi:16S rRNA (cytosine1402-N4)-methyltransferase
MAEQAANENSPSNESHTPVLFREVMALLQPRAGGRYIDCTVGAGGHSAGILDLSAPDGRLLGIDRDPEAIVFAGQRLEAFGDRVTLVNASFGLLATVSREYGFEVVDGVLLDLGLSSRQLGSAERGFSFLNEGPLDMRFDSRQGETAADLINNLSAEELADIFWRYGEEKQSRRLARLIVANRPLTTTGELAELVAGHKRFSPRGGRYRHPATQIFQALRIAVNDELAEVEKGLTAAVQLLKPGGRLAVISFHSLEDRLVKQFFRQLSRDCVCPPQQPVCTCGAKASLTRVTRKAVQATAAEIVTNPRSRSARLRVAARLENDI